MTLMLRLLDTHPVVFTVLALPVTLVGCVVVLGMCGVSFTWRSK